MCATNVSPLDFPAAAAIGDREIGIEDEIARCIAAVAAMVRHDVEMDTRIVLEPVAAIVSKQGGL